jgi:hypothetical protein
MTCPITGFTCKSCIIMTTMIQIEVFVWGLIHGFQPECERDSKDIPYYGQNNSTLYMFLIFDELKMSL